MYHSFYFMVHFYFPSSLLFVSVVEPLLQLFIFSCIMSSTPETNFRQQAEAAREALKNFTAIRALNAPGPIKAAVLELVSSTVSFSFLYFNFISLTHDLFSDRIQLAPAFHFTPSFSGNTAGGPHRSRGLCIQEPRIRIPSPDTSNCRSRRSYQGLFNSFQER